MKNEAKSLFCIPTRIPGFPGTEGDLGVDGICSHSQGSFARRCAESITDLANTFAHMRAFYLGSAVGKAESPQRE